MKMERVISSHVWINMNITHHIAWQDKKLDSPNYATAHKMFLAHPDAPGHIPSAAVAVIWTLGPRPLKIQFGPYKILPNTSKIGGYQMNLYMKEPSQKWIWLWLVPWTKIFNEVKFSLVKFDMTF